MAGPLFPERDEPEDLVRLIRFPPLPVGVAKDARRGILREKGLDPLLPA